MAESDIKQDQGSLSVLPKKLHFVGVGGIGMSGLAQMAVSLGCFVTGSDRAWDKPENARIMDSLKACGVRLFPQDGSAYSEGLPDAVVYSTAVEEGNPDFSGTAAALPRIHRSEALVRAVNMLERRHLIAVAGTCGKTSTSAWIGEALCRVKADPGVLTGGLVNSFAIPPLAGNFRPGSGHDFVIEADESDKSLLNYTPDTAVILNIGTDHYPREVLAEIFRKFMCQARSNIVIEDRALAEIGIDSIPPGRKVEIFSIDFNAPDSTAGYPVRKLNSFGVRDGHVFCSFDSLPEIQLPAPGLHNAANALAVYCTLLLRGYSKAESAEAVGAFSGVWRRFDRAGQMKCGAQVIDDYAHNAEKIRSAIESAHELTPDGRVFVIFQPHGFTPLKFMREELLKDLRESLRPQDVFAFLPVYYAGGTASFSPTSEEVAQSYAYMEHNVGKYCYFANREIAEEYLKSNAKKGDIVLICGARDNSLSILAKKIAQWT